MARKLYYCPFWLEAELEAEQEDEVSTSLNADEIPECQVELKKELFECESCSYSTENKLDLIVHIAETHQNQNDQDPFYNENIGSKTASGRRLKCSKCLLITIHKQILKWHFQHCHGERPVMKIIRPTIKPKFGKQYHLECLLCGVNCDDNGAMARHLYHNHNIDYPFECDLCHQKFAYENNLTMHQLTHYNALGWSCHLCKTTFRNKVHLNEHLTKVHQRHICARCNSTFESMRLLQKHLLNKHLRYICSVCKKIFRSQTSMNLHRRKDHQSRSGLRNSKRITEQSKDEVLQPGKRLNCTFCKFVVYRHVNLRLHMEAEHPEKMLPCSLCHRKFTCSFYLKTHVRNMHSGPIMSCEFCKYSTRSRCSLVCHWRRFHMIRNALQSQKFKEPEPVFIQITRKTPTTRTYGNRKLLKKVNEDGK